MNRKRREQLILDAAIRIFARQGYAQTSVSEIIDEANVARGTFYLYFKSKKDIFNALLDRFMMEVIQGVTKINALQAGSDGNLANHFRKLASDFILVITKNRQLTKIILFNASGLDSDFDAKLNFFNEQLVNVIRHNLDLQISAGIFRPCATEVVARAMIGSVKELISVWVSQARLDIEPVIQGLIDYLLQGVMMPVVTLEKGAIDQAATQKSFRADVNFH